LSVSIRSTTGMCKKTQRSEKRDVARKVTVRDDDGVEKSEYRENDENDEYVE